jgi:hypothetical protein
MDEFKLITENQGFQRFGLIKNNLIINNINYMHTYKFHLGNCFILKKFSEYCVNYRGGEFLKFTKPFSFISKKKKK